MAPFNGRGDNMVKLRGLNIWPESVGECAAELPHVELDYFVRVVRIGARDEMIVTVASTAEPARFDDVREQIEQHLRRKFELRIGVEVVRPGELDVLTEARTANKPRRFRDERPRAGATAAMAATT
jgi:phenylacetate-CoA ligase